MGRKTDIVVIGGGILGMSVAHALTQRGQKRVTVLEARQLGAGGTGRSSGLVRQFYLHPTLVAMAREGLRFYMGFADEIGGGDAGFVNSGLVIGGGEQHRASFEQGAELQHLQGSTSIVIDTDAVRELVPGASLHDVTCALFEPESGYADPAGACIALAASLRTRGVVIRQRTPAVGIQVNHGRVVAVETANGPIQCGAVINVAGIWADRVASWVGAEIPLEVTEHTVITVRSTSMPRHIPAYSDPFNLIYTRPESGDQLLIGSTDPRDAGNLVNPDLHSGAADPDEVGSLIERACERFPGLADGHLVGQWSGMYDGTPDAYPIIDRLGEADGMFLAAGLSGHGFKFAPAIARIVASLVLDKVPTPEAHLFERSRFAEGKQLRIPTTTTLTAMHRLTQDFGQG